jgi:hypothetical protein
MAARPGWRKYFPVAATAGLRNLMRHKAPPMAPQPPQPDGKTLGAAVLTVAAVYVYFLIFAQFGFLKAVQAAFGDDRGVVRSLMTVMGLAGIAGSVLAARGFAGPRSQGWLAAGFACCAAAAVGSMGAGGRAGFSVVALLTGTGAGVSTVTLAGMLRRATGDARLGVIIGLGTGLAYGFCNLPAVFEASATTQAWFALAAAGLGLFAGRALWPRVEIAARTTGDYSPPGTAAWVLAFLALVSLDSALFYFVQHTPEFKQALWTGAPRQWLNAGVHVVAALVAGWALDRGWLGRTLALAAGALLLAALCIGWRHSGLAAAGLVYIAGVSVYSTLLVFYPARSGRPGLAALVYAVAGWGGSALGIGLAQGQGGLPSALLGGATAALALAFAVRHLASRQGPTMNENNRA